MDDFRIEHDDVVVTLQTAVNLLRMAQDALYEKSAYSFVGNITLLNEWTHDGRNTNQR